MDGTVNINDEVAAKFIGFTRDGVIPEADDIGGAILSKIFTIGLGDAFIIGEYNRDFSPDRRRRFFSKFLGKPIG